MSVGLFISALLLVEVQRVSNRMWDSSSWPCLWYVDVCPFMQCKLLNVFGLAVHLQDNWRVRMLYVGTYVDDVGMPFI